MPGMKLQATFPLQPMPGWDDYGTGHATMDYLEGSTEEVVLTVLDMQNDHTMLLHLITSDDIYRKQEDTFISWSDPEAGMLLSLSFQDAAGCSLIWDTICKVQRHPRDGIWDDTDAPRVVDPQEPPK